MQMSQSYSCEYFQNLCLWTWRTFCCAFTKYFLLHVHKIFTKLLMWIFPKLVSGAIPFLWWCTAF